jgi:hypothetical protein
MTRRLGFACLCVLLVAAPAATAQERDPKLPAGRDPGGIAVALFTTGLDYTQPDIAPRLARDGEGELIGWDFVDSDNRPFAAKAAQAAEVAGDGTELARRLLELYAGARLVPVRVRPGDPNSFAQAVAFVSRTPARIVAVPFSSRSRPDWEPFRQAVERLGKELLFVLSAGDEAARAGADVWPAGFALPNAIAVAPAPLSPEAETAPQANALITPRGASLFGARGQSAPSPAEAVALAAGLAACAQHKAPAPDAASGRRALLSLGSPEGGTGATTLDPVCLYGGQRH